MTPAKVPRIHANILSLCIQTSALSCFGGQNQSPANSHRRRTPALSAPVHPSKKLEIDCFKLAARAARLPATLPHRRRPPAARRQLRGALLSTSPAASEGGGAGQRGSIANGPGFSMVWHKVTDALSAKLAFFPPSPPSYQLAQHGDGEQETYIQPLCRWACSSQLTCVVPALKPVAGCSAAVFLETLLRSAAGEPHGHPERPCPVVVSSLHQAPAFSCLPPAPQPHQEGAPGASLPAGLEEGNNSRRLRPRRLRRRLRRCPGWPLDAGVQPRQRHRPGWAAAAAAAC